ncbi:MAG: PD-(D/E)XK nuclease family protein [Nanoarchaeota archaeon]|nr:PD-(D/E)XK nuclease family protein [Nanoarchaeota archaeon]
MTTYSHSRLGTFQQCKYKYKLQYVDKIKVDIPDTVETFMGKLVHETLEKLYKDLKYQKLNAKKELLNFFEMLWDERWSDNIVIVKDYSQENYKEMGKKFISDYYDHYKPFNHLTTIGLETEDRMKLENENQYHIRIDRLACDKEGNYYVCDYKTNNKLKAQEELDEDRQLAMYSLWVKNNFKDCKNVKLVWYFLAFDKEMISERSEEQLQELKIETEELIKEIEVCDDFPTTVTALCDWCKFKSMCPAWKHEIELEEKTPEEFKDDDGVRLVDELTSFEDQKKEAVKKIEEIKEQLIQFAKQKDVEVVWGTDKKASVKPFEKIDYPKDEEFIELLKQKGVYDDLVTLNYSKLASKVKKNLIDKEILDKIKTEESWRISLSKRKE